MRTWLPALVLATSIAAPAHADDGDGENGLYLGTGNHVKIGTGLGIVSGVQGGSVTSLTPTLEGRFKLGESFGLQVVLPFAWVSLSPDSGEGSSRFDIGNPSVAFEAVLSESGRSATIVRGGVALPLLTVPEVNGLGDLADVVLLAFNSGTALGTYGGFNAWRYLPERLSVFGEIVGAVDSDGLFLEFAGGIGLLIPTSDNVDTEVVVQASAKLGFGTTIIPFIGFGFVVIPTEYESVNGDDDGDAFQASAQVGVIANLGGVRLDLAANFNLDEPFGFSFDDNRVFGLSLGATVPF